MAKYLCKICDYNTDRKHNLTLHNLSQKHLKNIEGIVSHNNNNIT